MNPDYAASFDAVRRQQLRDGIGLSTQAKIAFFEEMVALAVRFGATDRLAGRTSGASRSDVAPAFTAPDR